MGALGGGVVEELLKLSAAGFEGLLDGFLIEAPNDIGDGDVEEEVGDKLAGIEAAAHPALEVDGDEDGGDRSNVPPEDVPQEVDLVLHFAHGLGE